MSTPTQARTRETRFQYAPVGALVHNAYWREQYRVLAHNDDGSVTIVWVTGTSVGKVSTHFTPYEHGRDRILKLADMTPVKCDKCLDTGACLAHEQFPVSCARCAATGQFITGMRNGKPTGPGGQCFRCGGKGFHTPADRKRNNNWEVYGQRV